jgi:hypothetical protein
MKTRTDGKLADRARSNHLAWPQRVASALIWGVLMALIIRGIFGPLTDREWQIALLYFVVGSMLAILVDAIFKVWNQYRGATREITGPGGGDNSRASDWKPFADYTEADIDAMSQDEVRAFMRGFVAALGKSDEVAPSTDTEPAADTNLKAEPSEPHHTRHQSS